MKKAFTLFMIASLALFVSLIAIPQSSFAQKQLEKYANGKKKFQGTIRDGIKTGTHKYWYENGKMKLQERYTDVGILIAVKEWDEEGELIRDEKPEENLQKMRVEQFKNIKWWTTEGGVFVYKTKGENGIDLDPINTNYVVHYVIYLQNGKEVESSIRKNTPLPLDITAGGMIDGFIYGLKQFKEGERGFIKIPSRLGYGAQGTKNIPPHSLLYFQVIVLKAKG